MLPRLRYVDLRIVLASRLKSVVTANGRCEAVRLNICNIINMQCLQGIYLHAKLITFGDIAWYSPSLYID